MKKIFLIIPLVALSLNAEMIAQGESSAFIGEKDSNELSTVTAKERTKIKKEEEIRKANLPPKKVDNSHLDNESLNLLPKVDKQDNTELNLLPQKDVPKNVDLTVDNLNLNPLNNKEKVESSIKSDKVALNKIELKQYNITYDTEYLEYSIESVNKDSFSEYLNKKKINPSIFKKILNSDHSLKTIKISAYYYDYYLGRPDYAENFYRILYKKRNKLKLGDQFVLADYLLRTGRGDKIHTFIKREVCSTKFGNSIRGKCFYYLGLDYYLRTGERKNGYMKIAKSKLKKAKKFYYSK